LKQGQAKINKKIDDLDFEIKSLGEYIADETIINKG
jgi:hypothetical protein